MTTSICRDLADYHWLTGEDARTLLAELAADSAPLHTAIARLRRRLSPLRTHLAIELVELRRRAAAKFTHADRMFFTRTTLEQATDEQIAQYKSKRLTMQRAGSSPSPIGIAFVADLCCGIGGDLLALAQQAPTIGADLNPIATHFAAANARVVLNREVDMQVADVAEFSLDGVTAWHIDPDRRATGRRTISLDNSNPNRATIDRLLTSVADAAIKLAPATEIPDAWSARCEREWISRDRECRQQVAWHGNLANAPGQHRATVLPSTASRVVHDPGIPPRTIVGQPNQPIPLVPATARYIFDIDPAVRAAHLTGALAAERNLHALAAGPTYLTGDVAITSDVALDCFEVLDQLPLRTRPLAQHLRALRVGTLEIKKRGVDTDPEKLRRDLNLHGDNSATLILAKLARRPTAILARRLS